ncbi:lysine N(6)-hydroxylase/L-ornithine N(5)-oxygenase family protein [Rhodococcoides kyotonense]|nr:SidA/IucD/PvdA family monooxygenase [Rhodococcus kyotonensis]
MSDVVSDVIGIGFGPSNLGFAIAASECQAYEDGRISAVFVESKQRFGWHPGMMLPGATMQIAFPKDLVTMRNPRSEYSFFSYLHEQGRMVDFINHQTFFPSRREFGDYLAWAAERVNADVRYGTRAVGIRFENDLAIVICDGPEGLIEFRARNVLFAPGLTPRLPDGVRTSDRVFHNHGLLEALPRIPSAPTGSFVVLGAGQSAAEVAHYLHSEYPTAEVHVVHAKFGMTPADDSPFANRVFDPDTVDRWYGATPQVRARMLNYHKGANYSAVDGELIAELYRREYQEKVAGARRLFVHGATELRDVSEGADSVTLDLVDQLAGESWTLETDALICATGFRPGNVRDLLGDAAFECSFDGTDPVVSRDYRLHTSDAISAGIYLNGGVQGTHGLSSTLLSTIAIRSGEILDSVRRHAGLQVS